MDLTESIKTTPIEAQQSVRKDELRVLTSGKAGKILPIAYVPLLREDRVSRGQMRVRFEMAETVRMLMNAINVTVYAHFVPFLAFERFNGLDQLNRSYKGIPEVEGGAVVPFFETIAYDRTKGVFSTLGIHAKDGEQINSAVVEAYNCVVNFRRSARSPKLPLRTKNDTTLAAGFWKNPGMRNIVPDFEAAMMDGEVELTIPTTQLPVKGLAYSARESLNPVKTSDTFEEKPGIDYREAFISIHGIPRVFAELQSNGVRLSLANIEVAKKTAAFAQLRQKFDGLDDEYLIDLLMEAIRVPDAQMAQPILLDRKSTIMGYSKRYATDGANLDQYVTTGETYVDVRVRTPAMNTGGIILITAEIVPEQLFERQQDMFLYTTDPEGLPQFLRDYLDPEKVDVVKNKFVDVEHTLPDATFGYAPLNHAWNRQIPRIGGKFHRQIGDPFVEDRQRIWSVETVDPTLTEDFYLVNDLHHNVFADTTADPFEIVGLGRFEIVGNTVFGKRLTEDTGAFSDVNAEVDNTQIEQA